MNEGPQDPDTLNDAFKANIERTLRERGMNKRQLSKLMGVHKDLVRVQLNRPGGVTLRTVQRYSDALGIPAVELITPSGSREHTAMSDTAKWEAVSNEWDRQRRDYRSAVLSDYDSKAPLFNSKTERLACLQAARDEMIRQGLITPRAATAGQAAPAGEVAA